ncbi:Zn-ribbon domain-containing OB-fold protein [Paraburkholderia aspalathi]|uniref:Zn-ribbon domain-containing OB-fold protein n=1 Tax=Paraburkholderia aspalathi TaxID=1324617 RepID=UPI001B15DF7B|nr:Zn-ribbon domain-containing OB-fold protein [Paraburkholderia aspalathi]CAE6738000.1 hypothetical protein R20943_02279 [Paraburkholderia aspalathi]
MTDYLKPLPKSDPLTAPFWDSVNRGKLEIQCCNECDTFVFYPRALCPVCSSRSLTWKPVAGRGTIYSLTVVHRPTNAAFKGSGPYVVALVELEEGCRMMTNVIDVPADPKVVKIGMPVEIVYDRVTEECTLPKFRPIKSD